MSNICYGMWQFTQYCTPLRQHVWRSHIVWLCVTVCDNICDAVNRSVCMMVWQYLWHFMRVYNMMMWWHMWRDMWQCCSVVRCSSCNCSAAGSINRTCSSSTGECVCKQFVTGRQCDTCVEGATTLRGDNPFGCSKSMLTTLLQWLCVSRKVHSMSICDLMVF